MKKITLTLLIGLTSISVFSQIFNFVDQPYFETSAKADTLVSADRIYLTIETSEQDTGNVSIDELESKMTDHLQKLNVNPGNQLALIDSFSEKSSLKKKVFLKSKAYSLLVYDTLTARNVITAIKRINGSKAFLDKIEYSKTEELKQILKPLAVQKAKRKATLMSATLNQKIGSAIYISDLEDDVAKIQQNNLPGGEMPYIRKSHAPSEFEKIKVESKVKVTFELY